MFISKDGRNDSAMLTPMIQQVLENWSCANRKGELLDAFLW